MLVVVTGGAAGIGMGYVPQRGQLCFHSMIDGAQRGRFPCSGRGGWASPSPRRACRCCSRPRSGTGLDHGLPFAPVGSIAGGLLIGLGMVVARTCVSGLYFKLSAGMLGATIGLAGWAVGELVAHRITMPGPVLLPPGDGATVPGLLGVPRIGVAVAFLAVVGAVLWRRRSVERPKQSWQWGWPMLGVTLGAVTVAGWALAALGGSPFGPSSVGAVSSIAAGTPNWWLISFLVGIVVGALVSARTDGGFHLRGEQPVRCASPPQAGASSARADGSPGAATSATACPGWRSSTCRRGWSSSPSPEASVSGGRSHTCHLLMTPTPVRTVPAGRRQPR